MNHRTLDHTLGFVACFAVNLWKKVPERPLSELAVAAVPSWATAQQMTATYRALHLAGSAQWQKGWTENR